jgi:hypothetical protein
MLAFTLSHLSPRLVDKATALMRVVRPQALDRPLPELRAPKLRGDGGRLAPPR